MSRYFCFVEPWQSENACGRREGLIEVLYHAQHGQQKESSTRLNHQRVIIMLGRPTYAAQEKLSYLSNQEHCLSRKKIGFPFAIYEIARCSFGNVSQPFIYLSTVQINTRVFVKIRKRVRASRRTSMRVARLTPARRSALTLSRA